MNPQTKISQAVAGWLKYCQRHNKSGRCRTIISRFAKSLPETIQTVEQINKTHIEDFVVSLLRKYPGEIWKEYLPGIRGFLRFLTTEYGTALITIKRQSNLKKKLPKIPILRIKGNPEVNVIEEWLLYIEGLSKETKVYYKRTVLDFFSKAGYTTIDELELCDLRNYVNKLLLTGKKKSTVNNYIIPLRTFGNFLLETYGISNPAMSLKKFKVGEYHQPFITQEQYEKILATATQKQSDIIKFLAHTGLRSGEFVSLEYHNITENFSAIRFIGKGSKERTVPLNNTAREILVRHCNGEKIVKFAKNRKNIYNLCVRAGNQVSIALAPHMLRRFFGSALVHRGLSLLIVSKLLGHSSIQTTERYLKVDSSYLNGATDILDQEPKQERGAERC